MFRTELTEESVFIGNNFEIHKFGGTTTGTQKGLSRIVEIVREAKNIPVLVVSAAMGVTDLLVSILENLDEEEIPKFIEKIVDRYDQLSPHDLRQDAAFLKQVQRLKRVLYGICYTEELSGTLHDLVLSFGERLVTFVISDLLSSIGKDIFVLYPEKVLITDGRTQHANIDLDASEPRIQEEVQRILSTSDNPVIIIPGFYGISQEGKINLLGRSGTDYSASAAAYLLNSSDLTIWKDVPGFLSVDPKIVPEAQLIPVLSYGEAAELSHFGAKILHHRAVLPAHLRKIPIYIRNIYNPSDTTLITEHAHRAQQVVKSISYTVGLSILKFYNSVGASEPGIMNTITSALSNQQIEIISVATSQTCIAFLVRGNEVHKCYDELKKECRAVVDSISIEHGIALIACVGEELAHTHGVAFRLFGAVAGIGVNVDMISAGASSSALHFTVSEEDLSRAVQAIHHEFIAKT